MTKQNLDRLNICLGTLFETATNAEQQLVATKRDLPAPHGEAVFDQLHPTIETMQGLLVRLVDELVRQEVLPPIPSRPKQ